MMIQYYTSDDTDEYNDSDEYNEERKVDGHCSKNICVGGDGAFGDGYENVKENSHCFIH